MTQKNTKKNKRSLNPTPIKPKTPPEITPRIKNKPDTKKNEKNISPCQSFPTFNMQNQRQTHLHI